jgi:mannose-6-phosphate isomerase-like protein (cupin superfamily)
MDLSSPRGPGLLSAGLARERPAGGGGREWKWREALDQFFYPVTSRKDFMGLAVSIDDVEGREIAPGVIERVLLKPEQTNGRPSGDLTVKHYTLSKGGTLSIGSRDAEHLEYVITGTVLRPRAERSRYLFANTVVLAPYGTSTVYIQAGEGEARILSHVYSIPNPTKGWGRADSQELEDYWGERQSHAPMPAAAKMHRMGGVSPQLKDITLHTNPAETAYFMRGRGTMRSGDRVYDVSPGSLVYTMEHELHEIRNSDIINDPLHYIVIEFHDHDPSWTRVSTWPRVKYHW